MSIYFFETNDAERDYLTQRLPGETLHFRPERRGLPPLRGQRRYLQGRVFPQWPPQTVAVSGVQEAVQRQGRHDF